MNEENTAAQTSGAPAPGSLVSPSTGGQLIGAKPLSQTTAKPSTPLEAALTTHVQLHDEVSMLLSRLEDKLQPVLRATDDAKADVENDTLPGESQLVGGIKGSSYKLRQLGLRIDSLIQRIDL